MLAHKDRNCHVYIYNTNANPCISMAIGSGQGGRQNRRFWRPPPPEQSVLARAGARTDGFGARPRQRIGSGGGGRQDRRFWRPPWPEPTVLAGMGARTVGSGARLRQNRWFWRGRAPWPEPSFPKYAFSI